ncbi:MAG TPA: AraC family transcriptional regulator [Parafilimonas sp.]|nr:AraC family transcriptional regulator [Parafilimonas sp.]
MIKTTEIAPAPALAPFVRCYVYREFDTKGSDLIKPWHASHETSMDFFFKALPVKLVEPETGKIIAKGSYASFNGLSNQYNGLMTFNGNYSFFEVMFKPTGFNKLFRLASADIVNQIICIDDIFDSGVKNFSEQLCMAKGLTEMASFANAFLLPYLNKQKSIDRNKAITCISNLIYKSAGCINIDKLAYDANMCTRTFERHFIEQVGMSPKLFTCITRFNHAFELKLKCPESGWTSIAHQCGYFDQMHLIKDFKRFAGYTPSAFIKQTPLTEEIFTNRVEV